MVSRTTIYCSPEQEPATFDNAIAREFRKPAKLAKLTYGQASGFTAHSLRHTFGTHLMEVTAS
jgi:integrase